MAFIDGSIAEGAGATDHLRWAQMTAQWLNERHGGAVVRNAAIGATPLQVGVYRVDRDMKDFSPIWPS